MNLFQSLPARLLSLPAAYSITVWTNSNQPSNRWVRARRWWISWGNITNKKVTWCARGARVSQIKESAAARDQYPS